MGKGSEKAGVFLPEQAVGLAIREIRTRVGISQEELGFRADLHRTFISDIERGARNPTVRTLWRIAAALQVKPAVIIDLAQARNVTLKWTTPAT